MSAGLKKAQTEMLATAALSRSSISPRRFQQGLLPKKIPQVPGYEIAAFYAPPKKWAATSTTSSASTTSAWPWWWRTSRAKACRAAWA